MRKNVWRVTFAVLLLIAGWSARGWARPATIQAQVTFDGSTGEVTAECGSGCLVRPDIPNSDEFYFMYACEKAPCRVVISGRGALTLDRTLR